MDIAVGSDERGEELGDTGRAETDVQALSEFSDSCADATVLSAGRTVIV